MPYLQKEYLTLVEQCMNFACQMMDLCRGTQEVEAVISEYMDDGEKVKDPLGRLRMAIRYEEKKVSLTVFIFKFFFISLSGCGKDLVHLPEVSILACCKHTDLFYESFVNVRY